MVYHHTNFVAETNTWWLRRIRPVFISISSGWCPQWLGFSGWDTAITSIKRFLQHGTTSLLKPFSSKEQKKIKGTRLNRNYGFNSYYKPTLERSRKKQIMDALGDDYQHAEPFHHMFMGENRSLE